jgi:hypothetical protein
MAAFFLDAGFERDPRYAEIYSQNHTSADSYSSSVEGGVELAALVRSARAAHNGYTALEYPKSRGGES